MKKLVFLLLVMFFSCFSQKAIAYDFSAVNDYGDTIYYNITSDSTVEVTFEGNFRIRPTSGHIPPNMTTIWEYDGKKYVGNIAIPSIVNNNDTTYTVTAIGERAFMFNENLYTILIPNSIKIIKDDAFEYCKYLNTIDFPNYLNSIGDYSFRYCEKLEYVSIPDSITIIPFRAFECCYNLKTIKMTNSVKSIATNAFKDCTKLSSIHLSDSLIDIGYYALGNCTSLVSIVLPNSLATIQGNDAFYGAFQDCTALKKINLPNALIYIGGHAFQNCISLDSIICNTANPPMIYNNTFDSYNIPVIIPCGSLESYRSAPYWSNFTNIYENCIGIKEIEETNNGITIYPNPAKDNITLKIEGFIKGLVFVYDIMGKEVLSTQISGEETIINISNFPSGVYILKAISTDNKLISNGKLIKQ